eukprot:Skav201896  [mRNA]  locus=scaffold550:884508:886873:+ [translate_table: standard]
MLSIRNLSEATEGIYPTADGWIPPAWPSNEVVDPDTSIKNEELILRAKDSTDTRLYAV